MGLIGDALHVWVPEDELDVAVDVLWQAGVVGIEERAALDGLVELVAAPDPSDASFWDDGVARLAWRHERRGIDVGAALDAWRPHARDARIAGVVVHPAWLADPVGAEPVLVLEPGRAWGHGGHPSTVLAGELLVGELSVRRPSATVLDVGCGSGVLALLAAYRGALVTALDIDPEARRATAANASRNHLEARVIVRADASLDDVAPHDLVAANLGIRAITELAEQLAGAVAPAGKLVVSGLLAEQVDPVVADAFSGWSIERRLDDPPWAAVVTVRR